MTAIPDEAPTDRAGHVVVIGSVNIDTVLSLDSLPLPGETRIAHDLHEHLGGKGQSQAMAAARFGSNCQFIAAVGKDQGADLSRQSLRAAGVDVGLIRTSDTPTGRAIVYVDARAENSIVVSPGANAELKHLMPHDRAAVAGADVLLCQLEVDERIVYEAITLAHESGVTVVLNAAPASTVPLDVLDKVDYLIVNRVECVQLGRGDNVDESARILTNHAHTVVVTLGGEGGRVYSQSHEPLVRAALKVDAVDTTGSGDTFCGVFAAAIAQQLPVADAFQLALIAGSLAALTLGNVSSIPGRSPVIAEFRRLVAPPS